MSFALLIAGLLWSSYLSSFIGGHAASLGSVSLYPPDIALIAALAIVVYRQGGLRVPQAAKPLLLLLALHTLWGVPTHGLQAVINDSRPWWWFLGALVIVASAPPTVRALAVAAGAVVTLAAFELVSHGVHDAGALRYQNGQYLSLRPLTAAGALLLLQLVIALAPQAFRYKTWLIGAAALVLLLTEQRTVWICAAAAAPILYIRWLRRTRPENAYASIGLLMLTLPLVGWALSRSHSLAVTSGGNGTLHWRIEGWLTLLRGMSPVEWLVGSPGGTIHARYVLDQLTTVEPHNLYVETLVRFGIVGIVALAVLVWAAFRNRDLASRCLIVSTLIYGATYGTAVSQGIALALILAVPVLARAVSSPLPTVPFPPTRSRSIQT